MAVLLMPVGRCRNAEDLLLHGIGPLETNKLQGWDGVRLVRGLDAKCSGILLGS